MHIIYCWWTQNRSWGWDTWNSIQKWKILLYISKFCRISDSTISRWWLEKILFFLLFGEFVPIWLAHIFLKWLEITNQISIIFSASWHEHCYSEVFYWLYFGCLYPWCVGWSLLVDSSESWPFTLRGRRTPVINTAGWTIYCLLVQRYFQYFSISDVSKCHEMGFLSKNLTPVFWYHAF